jgi:DnaJ-class molecular chaperone
LSFTRKPRGRVRPAPKPKSSKTFEKSPPPKLVFGEHVICPYCKGTGKRPKKKEQCGACIGTGYYSTARQPESTDGE